MRVSCGDATMAAAFLITFRETLEASLVVVIVLSVLDRFEDRRFRLSLWNGVLAGLCASLFVAIAVRWFFSSLAPEAEPLAEGITMLLAAALLTWMIVWMSRFGSQMRDRISVQATDHLARGSAIGIFLMSFLAVVREGTETVLFLQASLLYSEKLFQHIGAFGGITIAIVLSALLLKGFHLLPLRWVFRVTNVLLIVFAVSLLLNGLHELEETGLFALYF